MSQLCEFTGGEKVLEIGCGSGYQAAILSKLAKEIYSIERIEVLAKKAGQLLIDTGCLNVKVIHGDGYAGYPEAAPFDVILLTAAPDRIPQELIDQMADNGRLIAPVGESVQKLVKLVKRGDKIYTDEITYVRFVPMVKGSN